MKFGMNLLMWTDTVGDAMIPFFEELKEIGFDAIEIPIFDHDEAACAKLGKKLDELGLARSATGVRGVEHNPISPDPAIRAAGVEANKRMLDCSAAAGCSVVAGPFHSALGFFTGKGPTEDEFKWGVESMREAAEHAEKVGVKMALEAVNRFECYFMNTAEAGVRFCDAVDHPYCGMMYDTFHAHIEEKNVTKAIESFGKHLFHVHISENDRSTPGAGQVRWDETFDALKSVHYDGFLVIEAFGLALKKLIAATKIWRRMYESEKQLASDGLAFMKEQVGKRA
jgi:D-psicose/D-tagatose/L-ribulose 3-epimerase